MQKRKKTVICLIFLLSFCLSYCVAFAETEEDKEYRIRPNDVLDILIPLNIDVAIISKIGFSEDQFEIFGNEIFTRKSVKVDPYGYISLPLVGYISVEDKTMREFSIELTDKLKKYVHDVRCEILIRQSAPFFFYIFGEVIHPAKYEIIREITAFEAIAMAGGFTKDANKKKVKVIRKIKNGYKIFTINLQEAIKEDSLDQNILIKHDDLIIIEESFF
ncbi:MAG: polysaccharide biosynthesis/export family protein [Candidatus Aureabacteria bacterium]|nr:polysaccharide biosynthesis/export family protein [Candidatus Auribacterota bacterium]